MHDMELIHKFGADGHKWAQDFVKSYGGDNSHKIDEQLMIVWFCNAIMAGYDEAIRRQELENAAKQV